MALIEINPELKSLLHQLKRIADSLDMFLLLAYNYDASQAPVTSKEKSTEADVSYMTDKQSSLDELKAVKQGLIAIRDETPERDDEQVSYPFLEQR